jgi:hypothetical protein
MSIFSNWFNPLSYLKIFNPDTGGLNRQEETPSFSMPSQLSRTWSDPVTGLDMEQVATSKSFDTKSSKSDSGTYNWQGTKIDVYKASLSPDSLFSSSPTQNPILPSYENLYGTAPYVFPTKADTYEAKMAYDKTTGRYVPDTTRTGSQELSEMDRIVLGSPDTMTVNDIARSIGRRDWYSGGTIK